MRRTKSILAGAAAIVMMLAMTASPALAADNNRHDNRVDNQIDRLDNTLLVGGLFNDGVLLDGGLTSDFDQSFFEDIDHIDNGFIVDNDHGFEHGFVGDILR